MAANVEQHEEAWVPEDTFGARLVLVRRELGLTQAQAADACGLDDGSWSNWERGARPRGLDEIVAAIVKSLRVNRDWLMWGSTSARLSHAHLTALPSMLDRRLRSPKDVPLLTVVSDDE